MKNTSEITIHELVETIDSFTFQEGFASWTDNGVKCATSGWSSQGLLFVYRLMGGKWIGDWEPDDSQVSEAIETFRRDKAMGVAIVEAERIRFNRDDLFISNEEIIFTNVVAGQRCCNGGEYGFNTVYTPTAIPGVYEVRTETTCDFDRCGTGFEGFEALSISKYEELRAESDRIEAEGSKY